MERDESKTRIDYWIEQARKNAAEAFGSGDWEAAEAWDEIADICERIKEV